jgi:hypothetical protein
MTGTDRNVSNEDKPQGKRTKKQAAEKRKEKERSSSWFSDPFRQILYNSTGLSGGLEQVKGAPRDVKFFIALE